MLKLPGRQEPQKGPRELLKQNNFIFLPTKPMINNLKAIFIVAGHGKGSGGRYDPGAVANGTTERKEVLEIANDLKNIFYYQQSLNLSAIISVGIDENLTLSEKIKAINNISNKNGFDYTNSILISIHVNAGGGTGIEAWYYGHNGASMQLGDSIAREVSETTGLKYRGAKSEYYNKWGQLGIIHNTKPLAVLIECGFIDTYQDVKILFDPQKDDGFALGIAKGLLKFLGKPFNENKNVVRGALFNDVKEGQWFYEDVKICKQHGIFTGYSDGSFRPAERITRAEAAAVSSRLLKKMEDHKAVIEARLRAGGLME